MRISINPFYLPQLRHFPVQVNSLLFWFLSNLTHDFFVTEQHFPPNVSYLNNNTTESILARDAFLCAGYLMTPATALNSHRVWGFLIEHLESICNVNGFLRISEDLKDVDERVRTIFVERFAVGLTGWMLWNRYNITHISDVSFFINSTIANPNSAYNNMGLRFLRNGSNLRPDFFCLTNLSECVIAESKGGIGSPSVINSDLDKGKQQVSNVTPVGVGLRNSANRLVFGSYFRYENDRVYNSKDSGMIIRDPDNDSTVFEVPVSEAELILTSYLKLFNFCGLGEISRILLNGSTASNLFNSEIILKTEAFRVFPLLRIDDFVIGVHADIAEALFKLDVSSIKFILNEFKIHFSSTAEKLILPNGIYVGNV